MGAKRRRRGPKVTQVDIASREMVDAWKRSLIGGAIRGLKLRERVPAFFRKRGWDPNPELIECACGAIALVRVKAGPQAMRIPKGAAIVDTWKALPPITSASNIVGMLGMDSLLVPEQEEHVVSAR